MLTVSHISKSYGEKTLFSDLSFSVYPGDRIGIVGLNGSGKTTLLELLADRIESDSGGVFLQKDVTIGYLEQDSPLDPSNTVLQAVSSGRPDTCRLEHKRQLIYDRLAETNDPIEQKLLLDELAHLEIHYEHAGGYTLEYEAKTILAGLGFTVDDFDRPVAEFSGGWRMRAGLAKLLLSDHDILFLDEPTNHLDLDAIIWLEKFLGDYAGAVLLISHDRTFLNRICIKIIGISQGQASLFRGNYEEFLLRLEKEHEILEATIKNQERLIEHEIRFINRFRAKNTKASQVQSRIKRLEKIERAVPPPRQRVMRLHIEEPPRCGKTVLSFDKATFGYDGTPVYENLDLTIVQGEKIALVGKNGAGKSTLLKMLAGVLPLTGGTRTPGYNVTPVYYAQHQAEQLAAGNTVLSEMRRAAVEETDERLRTVLGAFLFKEDDVQKKVSVLSGGEKARLALAKLLLRPANFIILDEPTNHLDIVSRDILAKALESYAGTLCMVTHDRDLIDRVANRIFEITNGTVTIYHGNYSDYSAHKQRSSESPGLIPEEVPESAASDRRKTDKDRKRREGELRNRFYRKTKHIQDRIGRIESDLKNIETRLGQVEAVLADPSSCPAGTSIQDLFWEYGGMKERQEALNDEWLEASLELESIRETIYNSDM